MFFSAAIGICYIAHVMYVKKVPIYRTYDLWNVHRNKWGPIRRLVKFT